MRVTHVITSRRSFSPLPSFVETMYHLLCACVTSLDIAVFLLMTSVGSHTSSIHAPLPYCCARLGQGLARGQFAAAGSGGNADGKSLSREGRKCHCGSFTVYCAVALCCNVMGNTAQDRMFPTILSLLCTALWLVLCSRGACAIQSGTSRDDTCYELHDILFDFFLSCSKGHAEGMCLGVVFFCLMNYNSYLSLKNGC